MIFNVFKNIVNYSFRLISLGTDRKSVSQLRLLMGKFYPSYNNCKYFPAQFPVLFFDFSNMYLLFYLQRSYNRPKFLRTLSWLSTIHLPLPPNDWDSIINMQLHLERFMIGIRCLKGLNPLHLQPLHITSFP